jgi:hypothetical protein
MKQFTWSSLPAHEVSPAAASFLRKRGEDRDVDASETEILMEEGNIVCVL